MTPNVFETDTWPIGPVGCFNSLTLQGIVVIRQLRVKVLQNFNQCLHQVFGVCEQDEV